jgi:hypothetical protein
MFHSHWEMEVFAREVQDARLREAERERRSAAVNPVEGRQAIRSVAAGIAGAVRALLAGRDVGNLEPGQHGSIGVPERAFTTTPNRMPDYRPRVHPLTEPYAAMTVVARGTPVTTSPRASGVSER